MDYTASYASVLGNLLLASDGSALVGLWFAGQRHFASTLSADATEAQLPIFQEVAHWLDIYFSGRDPGFTPPLSLRTTPFRRKVYELLLTIPYAQTRTYGEIARLLAQRAGLSCVSAQAVGGAVGHNPISIIIPCHRVIGANGSLTGYAAGTPTKRALLSLEHPNP